jgi:hypothetical protein
VNSYVVRISRTDPVDRERIFGHVERVGKDEKKEFRNIEELIVLLRFLEQPADYRFCVE